jgi:response regulator NasT
MRLRSPAGVKVLLVEDNPERRRMFEGFLMDNGYEVMLARPDAPTLPEAVAQQRPDTVMIGCSHLEPRLVEEIAEVQKVTPIPVVLFSEDNETDKIRAAVAAGVNAYIVVGVNANRVRSSIDLAFAQFEETQGLRSELYEATAALVERKLVERAKGIVMKTRSMNEEDAYRFMRKTAMDRNMRISDLAKTLIEAAELLS